MTSYTDLKARLHELACRISGIAERTEAHALIEELEQRIQSMGGSSDAATEAMPKATSRGADPCEPPAQSSAAPAPEPVAWRKDLAAPPQDEAMELLCACEQWVIASDAPIYLTERLRTYLARTGGKETL